MTINKADNKTGVCNKRRINYRRETDSKIETGNKKRVEKKDRKRREIVFKR